MYFLYQGTIIREVHLSWQAVQHRCLRLELQRGILSVGILVLGVQHYVLPNEPVPQDLYTNSQQRL